MSRFCIIPSIVLADPRMHSMSHLRILLALGQHTDKHGFATPSHKTLGRVANPEKPLSKTRVSHIVTDLVSFGYVEKVARTRRNDGGQTSNEYRVLFDIGGPESSPLDDEEAVASGATPVADSATPVALHSKQPPVALHGAQPHKNVPIEGCKQNTCGPDAEQPAAGAAAPADAGTQSEAGRKKINPQSLVDLYHENCPSLPRIKLLSDSRKQALRNRWRQAAVDLGRYELSDAEAGLDWWARYFASVESSDFLTGRAGSFTAGFDWLLKQANFAKVIEGNYTNREAM